MKNSILSVGTALSRAEQKQVFGGTMGSWAFHAGKWDLKPDKGTGAPGGPGNSGPCTPSTNTCCSDDDCCHYQHNTGIGYVCSSGVCAPGLSPDPFCDL